MDRDKKNVVLVLQFRGHRFSGWQRQRTVRTVQQVLEIGLDQLTGQHISTTGCSRTDAGVNARAMVVSFQGPAMPLKAYCLGLNSHLPDDLKVINAAFAPESFSARFSSMGKTYCYRILNTAVPLPLDTLDAWVMPVPLDVRVMGQAAVYLEGEHDFSAFRAAADTSAHSNRFIKEIKVLRKGPKAEIWVTGNAFLTNMVRIIAGTLVEVGKGMRPPEWVRDVLTSRDRKAAGQTAPARGLTLERVYYAPEDIAAMDFLFDVPEWQPWPEVIWKRRRTLGEEN